MFRTIAVVAFLVYTVGILLAPQCSTAQTVQGFQEEVRKLPDSKGRIGQWNVGGIKVIVNQATVITANEDVKVGVLVDVLGVASAAGFVAKQIVVSDTVANDVVDGPYVFWKDKSTAEVVTLSDGKVNRKTYADLTSAKIIGDLPGSESEIVLDPEPFKPTKADWEMPEKLMVISDLEGNYTNAIEFLKGNGVVDKDGRWNWGKGHLVLIGDLVDRGEMVTEVMWLVHRLERESKKTGGMVHYVLGNHEAMVMGGDTRYVHPRYNFVCARLKMRYHDLFGPKTEIGRWLRSKNGVVRVGGLLFVHGGYSPDLDKAGLSMDALNSKIRDGLPPKISTRSTLAEDPVGHQHGPFWYRGYFTAHAGTWGLASKFEIDKLLRRHSAQFVVVGHTLVDHVGLVEGTPKVIGVDVHWSETGEGLLAENNVLYRVSMKGERTKIGALESAKK